ncbi:MAG: spermidine/putrescine ABC transporter substrate-binding protein [Deltaproteobacteria bacterium]|nr:spermidine/putrescine ABC transporter substrate-binding protein [Deltaproteobacteria bacterium]
MKKTILLIVALIACSFGCGRETPVLHIYTWADYIKPELIERFERENSCRVVIDTFDSNEVMYAKLKAGAAGYDLVTPSSYMVKVMNDQGMLQKLDHSLLPNLKHIDPGYLEIAIDSAMEHSVPYMLTTSVIAYLQSRVPDFEPSWAMFSRPEYRGRMTMLNDMRETIGAALKSLGFSINSTDRQELEKARDVVIGWKKNLAKFENEQYKTGLASQEFFIVHGYSGDVMAVQEENDDIAYAAPVEGTSISCDDFVILTSARQVELAHRFINFLHEPDVAAENTVAICYLCPNVACYKLLPQEILDDPTIFLPEEIKKKCEVINDVGPALALYTAMWDQIKAAP